MGKLEISQERVRELLSYDAETGLFTWNKTRTGFARKGSLAGTKTSYGYIQISIDNVLHKAHRLAWIYVYGESPKMDIDHINGDRSDNRIVNLRDVDKFTNMQNRKAADSDGKSGLLGVTQRGNVYYARRVINGRHHYLGRHKTPMEAHQAYIDAGRMFNGQ